LCHACTHVASVFPVAGFAIFPASSPTYFPANAWEKQQRGREKPGTKQEKQLDRKGEAGRQRQTGKFACLDMLKSSWELLAVRSFEL